MFYINPRLHKPIIAVGGVVAGFAAGWTTSYFLTRRTTAFLQEHIDVLNEETRLLKEEVQPKLLELTEELRRRTAAMDNFAERLQEEGVGVVSEPEHPSTEGWEPDPTKIAAVVPITQELSDVAVELNEAARKSIFPDDYDSEWDQEAENASRQEFPGRPYIISYEEFSSNDFGFTQKTVTFYEGDEVLVDEHDVPIYDPGPVVGPLVFGKGSGDPNIVYVRNKKQKTEYEVIRDPGHYAMVVKGLQIEQQYEEDDIKHSAVRRFRREE